MFFISELQTYLRIYDDHNFCLPMFGLWFYWGLEGSGKGPEDGPVGGEWDLNT